MTQTKVHFGIGLFIGVVLTALSFQFFAYRYDVIELDKILIKQDKWSGNSWRYENDQWGKINDNTRDWKPVDEILMKAINMPADANTNRSEERITSLKKEYPELEKIPDEDIIKRINYIYARKIMVDFYFSKANVE